MPQIDEWYHFFSNAVSSIAKSFGNKFPESVGREKLEAIEERINNLWLSPTATWAEFQGAVGEYRMFWFGIKKES